MPTELSVQTEGKMAIRDIKAVALPSYAELSNATVTHQDMGDKTITTTLRFDGDITPDFSEDWAVEFRGEKYIMPLRQPQGAKENTSTEASVELTFQHWAIYWLKQKYFFQYTSVDAETAIPDKWVVPLRLNLGNFCEYLEKVLSYWYGDKITVDFNDYKKKDNGWVYEEEPTGVDISYSKVWDVLIKLYELYGVRWQIEANGDSDHYVIRIGYPTTEVSHIFEYGFEGGLLKTERQVQSDRIANVIMGRGGEKNVPKRYFKDRDPDNKTSPADPDWVPELASMPFTELRGATFRSYVQGWKTKHLATYRDYYKNHKDEYKAKYGLDYPDDEVWAVTVSDADDAYAPWAWTKGYTDTKFDPVEYVKDDESIGRYGELWDAVDNNEEMYPTIQDVSIEGFGRIDEVVAVEEITSDDIDAAAAKDAQLSNVRKPEDETRMIASGATETFGLENGEFEVPEGRTANLVTEGIRATAEGKDGGLYAIDEGLVKESDSVTVVNKVTGESRTGVGIPAGSYRYRIEVKIKNTTDTQTRVTVSCPAPKLQAAEADGKWGNTWDIWIKNVWRSEKLSTETFGQYVDRVWGPILGDKEGSEAKVVFSDGWLSTSEDYEFTIVKGGIHYDPGKTIQKKDENGNVVAEYPSHWRLTLGKSDADLESLGLYVPSMKRQASAGDHFFFTGIEMPFYPYVIKAEERVDDAKKDTLKDVKDINPTWVVGLDKVRIHNNGKANAIIESLKIGNSIRLADKRFIINEQGTGTAYETLYLQSVTYTYEEPTDEDANILPEVEVVLSDQYGTVANPVGSLQGEVSALSRQVGSLSAVEQTVRAVCDKLYLRKDGIPDRSMTPTEFGSLVKSTGFRSGTVGGRGWGIYKDENGQTVIETDRVVVREELTVNNLVINQVEGQGGTIVESAAALEITSVEETGSGYKCYFDQKEGTVANLFRVDDIAWNSRRTPENGALKMYRRRVTGVGPNYVMLTKALGEGLRPEGWHDSGVYGDGIPSGGDVIVQRGNYTDANRRFIKVRDVVGGGYERYLEGLDSVEAEGEEYYYAGRQSGTERRWYIGSGSNSIDLTGGVLTLNGVAMTVTSTVGGRPITDFVTDVTERATVRENLLRNTDFLDGGCYWTADSRAAVDYGAGGIHERSGRKSVRVSLAGTAADWQGIRQWVEIGEVRSRKFTISGYVRSDNTAGLAGTQIQIMEKDGAGVTTATHWVSLLPAVTGHDGEWVYFKESMECGDDAEVLELWAWVYMHGEIYLNSLKLEEGGEASEWRPSPADGTALRTALHGETTVEGGLVMTTQMRLGYKGGEGEFVTTAGMNGVYDASERGGGLYTWGGGDAIDPEGGKTGRPSTSGIRHDGTAYFCGNTLRLKERMIEIGDNLQLDDGGLYMMTADGTALQIGDVSVGEVLSSSSLNVGLANKGCTMTMSLYYDDRRPSEYMAEGSGNNRVALYNGTVPAGTELTGVIKVTATDTLMSELGVSFNAHVKIYLDDDVLSEYNVIMSAYTGYEGEISMSLKMPRDGTVYFRIECPLETSGLRPYDGNPTGSATAVFERGTLCYNATDKTVNGNDGFIAVWGGTTLFVNSEEVRMVHGDYGLRIRDTGFEKLANGAWVPANI